MLRTVKIDISTTRSEISLPEGVPAEKKLTKMVVSFDRNQKLPARH